MSVERISKLKMRPSVAVVIKDTFTEFFISDIRRSVVLQMQKEVANKIRQLDGKKTVAEWMDVNDIGKDQESDVFSVLTYLNEHYILINEDAPYGNGYMKFKRVYSLLENFFSSQSEVEKVFCKVRESRVMIIGLGSVGTWVALSLQMAGVKKFILVDNDRVKLSNLHRQSGFFESDLNSLKTEALQRRMQALSSDVEITSINDWFDEDFFKRHVPGEVNLMINCADKPTVDITSEIIGEYCMEKNITHIIGGGYNTHQTLVGQVVIPGQTACVECFRKNLEELNDIDTTKVRKLDIKNRKVGSFPPLSALSSSVTANEAFKVLAGLKNLVMTNNRTEFHLSDLNFENRVMKRRQDCKWCGYEGKYYQLPRYQDK